jgi:hypothetical protein
MDAIEKAKSALRESLLALGFDTNSMNRILDEDLPFLIVWEIPADPPTRIENAEAIVAFSFGFGPAKQGVENAPEQYHPNLHWPGKANEALADTILTLNSKNVPIFAQWEVAEALKARGCSVPDHHVAKPQEEYLGTTGVVEQFFDNGLYRFRTLLLVAHRRHAYRCRETLKKTFQKKSRTITILVPELPDVYDTRSLQPWTQSLNALVRDEVGKRFHNRFKGNI